MEALPSRSIGRVKVENSALDTPLDASNRAETWCVVATRPSSSLMSDRSATRRTSVRSLLSWRAS